MIIKNKLYGGKVEITFDGFRHRYTIFDEENCLDGEVAVGVTTALKVINKPKLIGWAVGCAIDCFKEQVMPGTSYDELQLQAILNSARSAHYNKKVEAGDLGTMLHKWIESYATGENPDVPVNPTLKKSVENFLAWREKYKIEFVMNEAFVYSRKFHYAGTLDFVCRINGHLFIGDIKTSSGVYAEQMIQTAAYRMAREEEYPAEKYKGQLIIRIGKDGSFDFVVLEDGPWYPKMKKAFVCAMTLSTLLDDIQNNYKPKYLK